MTPSQKRIREEKIRATKWNLDKKESEVKSVLNTARLYGIPTNGVGIGAWQDKLQAIAKGEIQKWAVENIIRVYGEKEKASLEYQLASK